jgi:hypothetical protein
MVNPMSSYGLEWSRVTTMMLVPRMLYHSESSPSQTQVKLYVDDQIGTQVFSFSSFSTELSGADLRSSLNIYDRPRREKL